MPLENRVTPFGEIVATPARGLFIGNRGIIHDPATRTLLSKRWATKTWLVCSCDYKGVRRQVMGGRTWTELFFLDEATALAAGHRPCFLCRRDAAERFRAAWAAGNQTRVPSAAEMDDILHRERLQDRRQRLHVPTAPIGDMPDGTMVAAEGIAWLIAGGQARRWSHAGYDTSSTARFIDGVLTPPSTLAALRAGYRPAIHASCSTALAQQIPEGEKDIDDVRSVRH